MSELNIRIDVLEWKSFESVKIGFLVIIGLSLPVVKAVWRFRTQDEMLHRRWVGCGIRSWYPLHTLLPHRLRNDLLCVERDV